MHYMQTRFILKHKLASGLPTKITSSQFASVHVIKKMSFMKFKRKITAYVRCSMLLIMVGYNYVAA